MGPRVRTAWRARLRRLRFAVLALVATGLILLGVLAGLTQLAMPWLQHHPQHIEHWLSARLQRPVTIGHLSGKWVGGGPLLALDNVHIGAGSAGQNAVAIAHAELAFDVYALFKRNSAFSEFRIAGLDLHLVNEGGAWALHGLDLTPPSQQGDEPFSMGALGALEITHLKLTIDDPQRNLHVALAAPVLRLLNRGSGTRVLARLRLAGSDSPLLDLVADLDLNARSGEVYLGGIALDLGQFALQPLPGGVQPLAGRGAVQMWARVSGGRAQDVRVRVTLQDAQFGTTAPLAVDAKTVVAPRIAFDRLAFVARWLLTDRGWTFDLADFVADRNATDAPARVTIERSGDTATPVYRAAATQLPLRPFADFAMLAAPLPPGLRRWLYLAHPAGAMATADLRWDSATHYAVNAQLRGLVLASADAVPGIDSLDIDLHGDAAALLAHLPQRSLRVNYPHIFRKPFIFSQLGGDVIARRTDAAWRLETDRIGFEGQGFGGELRGSVDLADAGGPPQVDLYAALTHGDVVSAGLFLPTLTMPHEAIAWLDRALVGGHLVDGRFALHGDLANWPFHDHSGRMIARGEVEDLSLNYDPEWPRAEKIHAIATFINDSMQVDVDSGESMGNKVSEASATIADFGPLLLDLDAKVDGSGPSLLGFLRATPIGKRYEDQLKDISVGGRGKVAFALHLPIKEIETLTLDGTAQLSAAKLDDGAHDLHFLDAEGPLRFNQKGFAADQLDVGFRDHKAKLSIAIGSYVADPEHVFEASLQGRFPATTVFADVPVLIPMLAAFPGEADWNAQVGVDASDNSAVHSQLILGSDLRGIAIDLPAPLAKTAASTLPFKLTLPLPYAGQRFVATLGGLVGVNGRLPDANHVFAARIDFGAQAAIEPPASGIVIGGRVASLDAGGWLDRVQQDNGTSGTLVNSIDLRADDFSFADHHFQDMHLNVDNAIATTSVRLDSAAIAGSLEVPRVDVAGRGLHAKFTRIHWPESETNAPDTNAFSDVAPASLPPLHIVVDDFQLGKASFGSAEFDSHPIGGGMHVDKLASQSPNVNMSASGDWTGTAKDNTSHLAIELTAHNLGHMMTALGFAGLIDGGSTRATIDASFVGPPSAFALAKLDGTLAINVAEGRILEVEPGAGRIFGLLSLTEIPRRLSLDFSDFFQSGLSFNSITGKFRLTDGNAYTNDLTIKSPAADIVLTGRTGLRTKDYDQTMSVTPHAGSTLPIVGAIAAGPVGAAAGLVMQGILNKPLGKATQRHYTVTGSWDKPKITLLARETRTGQKPQSAKQPRVPATAQPGTTRDR